MPELHSDLICIHNQRNKNHNKGYYRNIKAENSLYKLLIYRSHVSLILRLFFFSSWLKSSIYVTSCSSTSRRRLLKLESLGNILSSVVVVKTAFPQFPPSGRSVIMPVTRPVRHKRRALLNSKILTAYTAGLTKEWNNLNYSPSNKNSKVLIRSQLHILKKLQMFKGSQHINVKPETNSKVFVKLLLRGSLFCCCEPTLPF